MAAVRSCHQAGQTLDVRIANYLSLTHPYSVDLYIQNTIAAARLVVVRLLGGTAYWSYGTQQLRALAEAGNNEVIFLSGDGKPDPELDYLSSASAADCVALAAYLDAGGGDNARAPFYRRCRTVLMARRWRHRSHFCGRGFIGRV